MNILSYRSSLGQHEPMIALFKNHLRNSETLREERVLRSLQLAPLMPFDGTGRFEAGIPFSWPDYVELTRTLGRCVHPTKRGRIPEGTPKLLARMGMGTESFIALAIYSVPLARPSGRRRVWWIWRREGNVGICGVSVRLGESKGHVAWRSAYRLIWHPQPSGVILPTMTSVIELYEQISSAPDEKTRARLIVEAIEHVERRFPAVNDLATNAALRETELRLQKEIEQLRAETREIEGNLRRDIEQLRGDLQKEIEQLRAETREIEGNLRRDIEQLRGDLQKEIEQLRAETRQIEGNLR
ncbi:hypothetical protein, partial [Ectothiorhodospira haloalkaliphila]